MAPEHLVAMADNTPENIERVDERSDVFSLGVVFFELLTGRHPFRVMDSRGATAATLNQMLADRLQGPPAVRSGGIEVSPGLESIIAKCLAAAPAARYQRASELAEDLERFLDDMPLGFADDPSLRERTGKWLRRNPSLRSVVAAVAVVVALFVAMTAWFDLRRLGDAEELIAQAGDQFNQGATSVAADTLEEANKLLANRTAVARFFGGESQRAESQKKLQKLAKSISVVLLAEFASLADTVRVDPEGTASSGQGRAAPPMFLDPLSVFGVLERDDWMKSATFQAFDPDDQAQIEEDVTELLVVQSLDMLADAGQMAAFRANFSIVNNLTKLPPRHQRTHAVQMLMTKVQTTPGPTRPPAEPPADWDVFDLYLTGVFEAKEKRDETARLYFKAAADRCKDTDRPLKFWAHYQLADCAYRLRAKDASMLDEAVREYSACIVLREDFAWSYHNLGLVYHAQRKLAEAAKQFEEAIARDAKLGSAYANLAAVQVELGLFSEAEQTCTQAIDQGFRSAQIFFNRGCARAKLDKRSGAIQDFRATLDISPNFDDARNNLRLLESMRDR
jgi:tetratricopeptide (TPR) repeat protein